MNYRHMTGKIPNNSFFFGAIPDCRLPSLLPPKRESPFSFPNEMKCQIISKETEFGCILNYKL